MSTIQVRISNISIFGFYVIDISSDIQLIYLRSRHPGSKNYSYLIINETVSVAVLTW